jgi:hypothetical protein
MSLEGRAYRQGQIPGNPMASIHDYIEQAVRKHDEEKPFAPENGQSLKFSPGDSVIFTNDAGIEFLLKVTGYYERPSEPCSLYARGARYYLDWNCPWFPVAECKLRAA